MVGDWIGLDWIMEMWNFERREERGRENKQPQIAMCAEKEQGNTTSISPSIIGSGYAYISCLLLTESSNYNLSPQTQ